MDKQTSDLTTTIKIVKRKDHRNSVRGELFDQRVSELFYACWPNCYRGHKRWYSDLAGISLPSYYRIQKGLRGVSRKHFHVLNLMEVMLDNMGADFVRKLGPGFILGIVEYKPSPGTFASRRRKSRANNSTGHGATGGHVGDNGHADDSGHSVRQQLPRRHATKNSGNRNTRGVG